MRRVLATALTAALAVPVAAAPALAVGDPVTGYWSRTALGPPVPVQPPDPVPEGGMWVSRDPSGPVAVSAVRAEAGAGSVVVALQLPIADAIGTPAVLVCPTLERWAPEQGGRLEVAPAADCSAPVETVVEEAVLVVTLPTALQTDVVDVLLTPADGSAFSLTFERATAEAVVTAPAPAPAAPAGPAPLPEPAPESAGLAPAPSVGGGFPDLGLPAPAPDPLLPAPELPAPAAEAPVPSPQTAPAPAPAVLAAGPPAVDDRPVALLATGLLVLLGALALRLAVQPAAAPRHLGGGARLSRPEAAAAPPVVAAAQRGVGRFRAPRLRPPVRI